MIRKKLWLVALLTAVLISPSLADRFVITNVYEGTSNLIAREKASNKTLWQSRIKMVKTADQGKNFLYSIEEGNGDYNNDGRQLSWKSEAYTLISGDQLIPYETTLTVKDGMGKTVRLLEKNYDRQSGQVGTSDNGKQKFFEFKPYLLDKETLASCLRNFPFGSEKTIDFQLLTHEPALYKMSVKSLGKETISKNGKNIDCYKLQLLLDMGALNVFSGFFPKTYFWFESQAPHEFVRYEGLTSGMGTPYIVLETK